MCRGAQPPILIHHVCRSVYCLKRSFHKRIGGILAIGAGLLVAAVSHGAGRVTGVLLAATGGAIGNRLGAARRS